MFEQFRPMRIPTGEAEINLVIGGSGPPLLLLHGYPQTHHMWHHVAPLLAPHFTVVAPDLRGYGDSSRPPGGDGHAAYAKRAMANDQVAVMRALGFEQFDVAGHDRGARVAQRMALDHPQRVRRLAVLDIVPTDHIYRNVTREMAQAYFHWFFLIQPYDLPERLIAADPRYYLHFILGAWGSGLEVFDPRALAEYERCFADPATIHATCEDYRAAASVDLQHADEDAGRLIGCPLLAVWGTAGVIHRLYDVVQVWRQYAADVRGVGLPAGHFLAEERPHELAAALLAFFMA